MVSLTIFPKAPLLCLKSNNEISQNKNVLDDINNNNKPVAVSWLP